MSSGMREKAHGFSRWSSIGLAGLLIQDRFHGLDIDGWPLVVTIVLLAASLTFFVATSKVVCDWSPLGIEWRGFKATRSPSRKVFPTGGLSLLDD